MIAYSYHYCKWGFCLISLYVKAVPCKRGAVGFVFLQPWGHGAVLLRKVVFFSDPRFPSSLCEFLQAVAGFCRFGVDAEVWGMYGIRMFLRVDFAAF